MGAIIKPAVLIPLASSDPVSDLISAQNVPGILLLSTSGLVGMLFVVRWMIRFQKEFTNFYVEENRKLRERVDELEEEGKEKDKVINEQGRTIANMQIRLDQHEATITRLNNIIDRRQLGD